MGWHVGNVDSKIHLFVELVRIIVDETGTNSDTEVNGISL